MKVLVFGAMALVSAPLIANASCDTLKASIDAKLQAKHVENYSLEIRDASDPGDGKVIGHCEGDKKVIVYRRPAAGSDETTKTTTNHAG